MKVLIVATNATPAGIVDEIKSGRHHRVDYLELSERLQTQYMDYNQVRHNKPARLIEEKLRLDVTEAMYVNAIVRQKGYDVVFSMSERVGIPLGLMLDRHVKHIVQVAHILSPIKLRLIRAAGIPNRWHLIIVPTAAEAESLREQINVPQQQIKLLRYPVDTQFYKPLANGAPDWEAPHFESLGLSCRDYPTLIEAMRRLPHVTCYIRTGSTWVNHKSGCEKEALPENVQLKSYVHPSELRHRYSRSRFIVLPVRHTTQWSAGCTSVCQAQAMGRAVVATRTPGMADYVADGKSGLLVEESSADAMAAAIDELWSHPEKAAELGNYGRCWVQENLSLDQWLDNMIDIINAP